MKKRRRQGKSKHDFEQICSDRGFQFIKREYEKLHLICSQNHQIIVNRGNFIKGHGCKFCAPDRNRRSLEYVDNKLKEKGCQLISTVYKNNDTPIEYICKNGHLSEARFRVIISKKGGCQKCFIGETHPMYNPNLTKEERIKGRSVENYKNWRRNVMFLCDKKCVICSDDQKLFAHHLNGYSWDKENRTNSDNGVILCEKHHRKFHKIYSNNHNTKEQYDNFFLFEMCDDVTNWD